VLATVHLRVHRFYSEERRRAMPVHKGIKVAAQNRKARHDYFIEDTY
jgi:tmRNA-binding protein